MGDPRLLLILLWVCAAPQCAHSNRVLHGQRSRAKDIPSEAAEFDGLEPESGTLAAIQGPHTPLPDEVVLLSSKASLKDDGELSSWSADNNGYCAEFWGVTCDEQNRVKQLDVSNAELSGSLPPEWSKLAHMEQLYFDSNSLEGTIPSEYGSLSKLKEVSLYDNPKLTGCLPAAWKGRVRFYGKNDPTSTTRDVTNHREGVMAGTAIRGWC